MGTPRAAGQGREIAGPVAPAVDGMSPDGFALAPRDIRVRTLADGRIGRFAVVTALTIVVVAAVGLRFVDLASNPGGLYPDEAAEGLAARRILHEPGFLPVWFVEDGGREALFAYLVSAVFRLAGETIVALRAAAAA
ncbi:MAG TPA: hypothetical protein VIV06_11260, partial [Candidatus Limnocylindrales bacterium]